MTWLMGYAIFVTALCVVLGFGWHYSHTLILELADLPDEDWPLVKRMIRDRLPGRRPIDGRAPK